MNTMSQILPKRTKFTAAEDQRLSELVDRYGTSKWDQVAMDLGGRTPRQCRDRYNNYLRPTINTAPWTKEEEAILMEKFADIGPQWAQMVPFFHNRTCVSIKNHYSKLMKYPVKADKTLPEPVISIDTPNSPSKKLYVLPQIVSSAENSPADIAEETVSMKEEEQHHQFEQEHHRVVFDGPLDLTLNDPYFGTHMDTFWKDFDNTVRVSF